MLLDMSYRIDPGHPRRHRRQRPPAPGDLRLHRAGAGALRHRDRVLLPEAAELDDFVGDHGLNPFYRSLGCGCRCCDIRKVAPLHAGPAPVSTPGYPASGATRPRRRRDIRKVEIDRARGGLVKLNPLARLERRAGLGLHPRQRRAATTPSTTRATPASAARPAPAPPDPARIPAPVAGGGKATRPRSAACIAASIGGRCGRRGPGSSGQGMKRQRRQEIVGRRQCRPRPELEGSMMTHSRQGQKLNQVERWKAARHPLDVKRPSSSATPRGTGRHRQRRRRDGATRSGSGSTRSARAATPSCCG